MTRSAELADLLSVSHVGPKDGSCFTPAVFAGAQRRMEQANRIDLLALDADSGHSLDEIEQAVRKQGWKAIIHSTFSHLSEQTAIAAAAYDKWAADQTDPKVSDYLLAKKGYLARIVRQAEITDEMQDGSTRSYVVRHAPCPKFRIVLPLDRPWIAADYPSQAAANAAWKERVNALARTLGLHHDQSCVDTSRLFYLPRRRADQEFISRVLDGEECQLWTLPEQAPDPEPEEGLFKPRVVQKDHRTFRGDDGQWIDLTTWAAKYASRFEVATAIRAKAPGLLGSRQTGVKQHIECPNASEHVTGQTDRSGTFVVNSSQLGQAGLPSITSGFVIHCMHAGCVGKDRLDHLHRLLCDGHLSVADLTDGRFLTPAHPTVDVSALLHTPEAEALGNIPAPLYAGLPGVMQEMHDYINATSPKPQPALNLGAVLAFMAAAIGQRVQLQYWETRPNIYVLGVAHSGAGKERALSAIKQMARSAGLLETLVGVEEVASDAGIVSSVAQQPRQVILLDEVSFLIGSTNNKNAGIHMVNVIATLLKLYSSSRTTYKSKSYADLKQVKVIDQPCVSLYGCSTPAGLFSALSSRDITSGLLSRAVLFDAGDHDPKLRPPQQVSVPAMVTDWLIAWDRVRPQANPLAYQGGSPQIEPRIVLMTQEAQAIAAAFAEEMDLAKVKARQHGTDAIYVRATENAAKFALIRACAAPPLKGDMGPVIDENTLVVDAEGMRWAVELSKTATLAMERAAKEDVADSLFEQKRKTLRDFIKRCGARGASMRDLSRNRAGRMPERELEDILKSLTAARDVMFVEKMPGPSGRGGRPRAAFVHCSNLASIGEDD
jgi:hypothetical protein